MTRMIFVLGAPDPEMVAIDNLLRACGQYVRYALGPRGGRVTPPQAYRSPAVSGGQLADDVCYCVECDPAAGCHRVAIDHHRPGDPGYGAGPSDAVESSSLGQVISRLATVGALPPDWPDVDAPAFYVGDISYDDDRWIVTHLECDDRTEARLGYVPTSRGRIIPPGLVVTAACDHCLHHAWAGRVPGVTRDMVREYRATCSATRPVDPVSPEEYERRFAATLEELEELRDDASALVVQVDRQLPELPDVACYLGVAYAAEVTDRDGRRKIVLGGATTPDLVREWMAEAEADGLEGIYGDPERGFAGGYLT